MTLDMGTLFKSENDIQKSFDITNDGAIDKAYANPSSNRVFIMRHIQVIAAYYVALPVRGRMTNCNESICLSLKVAKKYTLLRFKVIQGHLTPSPGVMS